MSTLRRITATARDKKQKKGIFDGRTTWHFCSCGKKLRNASGSEKEKKRSGTQATNCFVIKYGISSITRAIRKFYVLDPVHTNSFSLSSKTHPSIYSRPQYRFDSFATVHTKTFENGIRRIARCDVSWTLCDFFGHGFHFDAFSTHFVLTNTICMRLGFDPLSRALLNVCVFKRALVWTGP